ncbi:MAG: stage III sporulation protein AE [Firmicutes bacterium]|nr:stage III sporulation protein AE [Bacillota bacterium]MCL5039103.1 stage III sporulation protein AE [Bacillota bacterium]
MSGVRKRNPGSGQVERIITILSIKSFIFWTLVLLASGVAMASGDLVDQQVESLDLTEVSRLVEELNRETARYLPEISLKGVLDAFRQGGMGFDFQGFLVGLYRYLFHEVLASAHLLGKLVILAVLCALLDHLQGGFEGRAVSSLAYSVCLMVLGVLAFGSFRLAVDMVREMVDRLVTFMWALLPPLITLLAGSGTPVAAGMMHPTMVMVINGVSLLVKNFILPALLLAAVLDILGSLSEDIKVAGLSGLLRLGSGLALGLALTIFLGVVSVQRAGALVADSLAVRTAKFFSAALIPGIGKLLSDAVEVVFTSSLVLRNALGALGSLAIIFVVSLPLIKILSIILIYRLAAALIQPLGGERISRTLSAIADTLTFVAGAALTVGVMFFIGLGIFTGLLRPG